MACRVPGWIEERWDHERIPRTAARAGSEHAETDYWETSWPDVIDKLNKRIDKCEATWKKIFDGIGIPTVPIHSTPTHLTKSYVDNQQTMLSGSYDMSGVVDSPTWFCSGLCCNIVTGSCGAIGHLMDNVNDAPSKVIIDGEVKINGPLTIGGDITIAGKGLGSDVLKFTNKPLDRVLDMRDDLQATRDMLESYHGSTDECDGKEVAKVAANVLSELNDRLESCCGGAGDISIVPQGFYPIGT